MKILNYKWYSFWIIEEENFFVAYFNFLDYHWHRVEVCITEQRLWSKKVYIAKFSWLTTEYIWTLEEVLDKVIAHYNQNQVQ